MKKRRRRTLKRLANEMARAQMEAWMKRRPPIRFEQAQVQKVRVTGLYPEYWPEEEVRRGMYEKLASFLRLHRIGELKRSEELEPWYAGSDVKWRSWEMEIRILAQ